MILKNIVKNKTIIIAIISFALGALIYNYSPVIFQEGNPWPQIKGMARLAFSNQDIVKLDSGENKYITRNDRPEIVKSLMAERGYDFREQLGSGYLFKSRTGTSAVATHRNYSSFYSLWTIRENGEEAKDNLWETATNEDGITFQYPKELSARYISLVEWPPLIKIAAGEYSCKTTPQTASNMSPLISQRLVDNRVYCVDVKHEGAAGSVYSSYTYTTANDGKLVSVSFTLRYPNCHNYNEEQDIACANERETFDIDSLIDRIVQTIK